MHSEVYDSFLVSHESVKANHPVPVVLPKSGRKSTDGLGALKNSVVALKAVQFYGTEVPFTPFHSHTKVSAQYAPDGNRG
jgi:hypothetical protein